MAAAFQADAFQTSLLAFQIDEAPAPVAPPTQPVGIKWIGKRPKKERVRKPKPDSWRDKDIEALIAVLSMGDDDEVP